VTIVEEKKCHNAVLSDGCCVSKVIRRPDTRRARTYASQNAANIIVLESLNSLSDSSKVGDQNRSTSGSSVQVGGGWRLLLLGGGGRRSKSLSDATAGRGCSPSGPRTINWARWTRLCRESTAPSRESTASHLALRGQEQVCGDGPLDTPVSL
jgi:hypothetical protein